MEETLHKHGVGAKGGHNNLIHFKKLLGFFSWKKKLQIYFVQQILKKLIDRLKISTVERNFSSIDQWTDWEMMCAPVKHLCDIVHD